MEEIFKKVRDSSRKLGLIPDREISEILLDLADHIENNISRILNANKRDLQRMAENDPKYDRLMLTDDRLRGIANDMRNVSRLPSPLNVTLQNKKLENGLFLQKVTVPLGVIGIIYEARPNVTFDVFALCLRSGNACVLKGGSDADESYKEILSVIHDVLGSFGITTDIVALLPANREATEQLLHAVGFVDVIIPRGSQNLIEYVRRNSKVPVIETGAGIVHAYFDSTGDVQKGANIIFNSKTRRVSVCNALDCLIVHDSRLNDLPALTMKLAEKNVIIYADEAAFTVLKNHYPESLLDIASPEHFGTEFLDYKMSICTVSSLDEALDHIYQHSSKHSEVIISETEETIERFLTGVDAAAVYANASTAFTDGAQFGMGAEIGISTQKLHARGPMALNELTSYKWIVRGNGTIRP